jgi:hypothetical protein
LEVAAVLTCEQVREMDAAYALDALSEADAAAVRAHLVECAGHPELADLHAAAFALAYAVEERQPSPGLRERVLRSAGEGSRPERSRWQTRGWVLSAAAVALVVIGGALGVALLRSAGSEGEPFAKSFRTEDGIEVDVEADFGRPIAKLTFAHLEVPAEGDDYVVWAIRDGVWLSMGRFRPNDQGWWSGEFAFQLRRWDSLCVTTGQPIDPYTPHGEPLFIEPL